MSNKYEIKIEEKVLLLNETVFDRQKISDYEKVAIFKLYKERMIIEMVMETTCYNDLKVYGEIWFNIERKIQELMKFQKNDNFIKFWTVPNCSCQKEENEKLFPTGNYKINSFCSVHGQAN
jgi:hypothetical protein